LGPSGGEKPGKIELAERERRMGQCPHPKTFTNPISGKEELNSLYAAWHEGYEDHKLELLTKAKYLEIYLCELALEVRKIKELKRNWENQRSKSG
jgi:hypothetical protein